MKNKVAILLSTYNGEKYLLKQLETLESQIDVDKEIFIRDDGSKDNTKNIILDFEKRYNNIHFEDGENLGYAKSFWKLLSKDFDESFEYFAFCDQDDIWLDNKLIMAINKISHENLPCLYISSVTAINNNYDVISTNYFNACNALSLYDSLQKNNAPGCVLVFNSKLRNIAKNYQGIIESHDWALYNLANLFGKIIYDNNSYIRYRIHENNTIGKDSKLKDFNKKVSRFFKKSTNFRSNFASDLIKYYNDQIPNCYYDDLCEMANYRSNFKLKIKFLINKKFKGKIFKIYILLNRI